MSDFSPVNLDASIFQSRMSRANPTISAVQAAQRQEAHPDEELQEASEQFESLMLNFMIREMRATVPPATLFPQSMAEEIFTGMLDEKIAGDMAESGGIGISRMIFNQLKAEK